TMEIVLQNLDGVDDRQLQTGFLTGEEYPLSNKMLPQRLLFWPKSEHYALIFMTAEDGRPAALQDCTIYRLPAGLPAAPVRPFQGSVPPRRMGVYYEDPVIPKNYGRTAAFPGFADTIDRMLDYMEWFGQDELIYPVVWYRGPIYESEVEPYSPIPGTRPHPLGYPQYLMKRLGARGMGFLPVFAIHEFPSLTSFVITDMERVAAGDETIINVRRDDTLSLQGRHPDDPDFNPLDPRVQQKVKDLAAEFLDLYGDEPALEGLMLLDARHKLFQFGSADSGYNDCNLKRFQDDTGTRLPVDPKDPKRFSKVYEWLRANAWETWLDWRCAKIHDYCQEIAGLLAARRPEAKLVIGLLPRLDSAEESQYLPNEVFLSTMMREAGIDVRLFQKDKNIEFHYLPRSGSVRWLRARGKAAGPPEDARTEEQAPEMVAPLFHTSGALYTQFDRYWENAIGANEPLDFSPLIDRPVQETTWRVSAINPNANYALEDYAAGLNNLDAFALAKGGFVNGTLGMEDSIQRFARAFRTLPAVRFDDVEGLSDPVRVRERTVDGRHYIYVLNRLPIALDAELEVSDGETFRNLVYPGMPVNGNKAHVVLAAYDLQTFRSDSASCKVVGCRAEIPAAFRQEFMQSLENKLAEVEKRLQDLRARGEDVSASEPYLRYAHECQASQQYARLYFLLQEGWAKPPETQTQEPPSEARSKKNWRKTR
ncbi:MAG: hypothetical protein NTW86_13350, partial [Candidatus Sumerlaeota bacterium]|nr:hypothetical protein [Candidatus Sumerlaeota bacterium]